MKNTCNYCEKTIVGRTDKKFCSNSCRNKFHQQKIAKNKNLFQQVDRILHRNHQILEAVLGNCSKMKVTREYLELRDFNFHYCTGLYQTQNERRYYRLYNFAWTEISATEVLVVARKIQW